MTSVEEATGNPVDTPTACAWDTAPEAVHVYYLAIEEYRTGYRWTVRRFGSEKVVKAGIETFASDVEARKAGRLVFNTVCATARVRGRSSAM